MKIECSRQLCAGRTDRQTHRQSDSLGSLTEPKIVIPSTRELYCLELDMIEVKLDKKGFSPHVSNY